MRLVMAVSMDGFVAHGPEDDMKWTGPTDKAVFKLLTMGKVLGAGRKTWSLINRLQLPGRRLELITTNPGMGFSLESFARANPDGVLIGGQTVALDAVRLGLITEIYWSRVAVNLGRGTPLDPRLRNHLTKIGEIAFESNYSVLVEVRR